MQHALEGFLSIAAAHPGLALALVALVAFAESLALVGTLVPAAVVMFGAGALVGHGTLGMVPTLVLAAAGAIAGDALSYELGRLQEARVRAWKIFQRYQPQIARAEAFIRRHGAASIVLARFAGPVRAFVPLLAGFSRMPRTRFYATNVASALLWAPAHILPGVAFGASLQLAEAASGRLALLVLILAALLWGSVWIVTRSLRWLVPLVGRLRDRALGWARGHDNFPARGVRLLLDPERPGSQALLGGLLLLAASMWLFLGVLEDVIAQDPLVTVDQSVFTFLQQLRTEDGDRVMFFITEMGSVGVLLPLIFGILAWLLWRRAWRTAAYWVATVASAEVIVRVLKSTLGRHRPTLLYEGVEQFSFPSGHATMSAVVLAFLAFLLTRGQSRRWRTGVGVVVCVYVVLVAFSRLYLGAHWFSDVVGGISFGLAAVALSATVYTQRQSSEALAGKRMAAVAVACLVLAGVLWTGRRLPADLRQYTVAQPLRLTSLQAWSGAGWRQLPQVRRDGAGEREEPMALQIACLDADLRSRLAPAGWQSPPPLALQSALLALTPNPKLEELPVLSKFDGGRRSEVVLARPRPGPRHAREVLRLWRSDWALAGPGGRNIPLWYGALYLQEMGRDSITSIRETPLDVRALQGELVRFETSVPGAAQLLLACLSAN
ncbi:MAG: superfamily protein [Ramlibacter sp.]|nr:superfamily protein [Ramlibacter sp.]